MLTPPPPSFLCFSSSLLLQQSEIDLSRGHTLLQLLACALKWMDVNDDFMTSITPMLEATLSALLCYDGVPCECVFVAHLLMCSPNLVLSHLHLYFFLLPCSLVFVQ